MLPAAPDRRTSPLHPARLVTSAFGLAAAAGTALLLMPAATPGPGGASFAEAAFTATSAVTVTGLAITDTASDWSGFGQAVILGLIQVGGLGIMTIASLILQSFAGGTGLRHRLLARQEIGVTTFGELRAALRAVLVISLTVEVTVAVVLAAWFGLRHEVPALRAVWLGVFHAVSAFANAGFALYSDSLVSFATDPVVNIAVMAAIVLGGLGVPVLAELAVDRGRWRRWSLHSKLTIAATAALIATGWVLVAAFEWTNPSTLGPLAVPGKLLAALFQSVTPRTAGFNTLDYGAMNEETWFLTSALMFVGAGPVSTGGGIRVTTFAMLAFVILAEVRGDRDVTLFWRRVPVAAQRQALSVALIGVGVVFSATMVLLATDHRGLARSLFEVTSAFGTVGLTTGITHVLSGPAQVLLAVLMFAGRVGPLTVGAALALRSRDQRYRLPEERPLIG